MLFGFSEAIPAKHRLISARLEWDFGLSVTLSAGGGIHLAGTSISVAAAFIAQTLVSSGRTTRRTTLGFIGEAFRRKELLLRDRKGERFSAIGTGKGFFCVSH